MATLEQDFLENLMLAIGSRNDVRVHRQNVGQVNVIHRGKICGVFRAGPPTGASDISGIVGGTNEDGSVFGGWRIEIELKGAKTANREAQESWGRMIEKFGGIFLKLRYNEDLTMDENLSISINKIDLAIKNRMARG